MSEQHVNIGPQLAEESRIRLEAESNRIEAVMGFTDAYPGWLNRVPRWGTAHPEYSYLKLSAIEGNRTGGNLVEGRLIYTSNDPEANPSGNEGAAPVTRYDLEAGTSEEPLLVNDYFSGLGDSEREAIQELLGSSRTEEDFTAADAAVSSPEGTAAIAKIRKGVEAFLNPGAIWVERKMVSSLPSLAGLGAIDSPPGGAPNGGTRTWLYIGMTARNDETGDFWEVERRWQLSEKGGWDTDLYGS